MLSFGDGLYLVMFAFLNCSGKCNWSGETKRWFQVLRLKKKMHENVGAKSSKFMTINQLELSDVTAWDTFLLNKLSL